MLNEIAWLIIGLIIGFWAGLMTICFFVMKAFRRKDREIARLKAQVTIKAILAPVFTDLAVKLFEEIISPGGKNGHRSKK